MTVLPRTGGRTSTAIRLAPSYARHLVLHPYRASRPLARDVRVWETAAYDLFLNLLLSGYARISGRPVRPGTAQLLILLNRIAFLLDDEFERRIHRASVAFDDLIATEAISGAVGEMRSYLAATCEPAQCDAIRLLLRRTVEEDYRRYAVSHERRTTAPSVTDLLEDAAVDSGVVLRQLAEVIGMFQGTAAPRAALDDFTNLGLACKFADDLRDWRQDLEHGAENILLALLTRHPDENRRLAAADRRGLRMNEHRWQRLFPRTFSEFADRYRSYYTRIGATPLRWAADLMMETGRVGHLPKTGGQTAARN
jgi:hypothetical protein